MSKVVLSYVVCVLCQVIGKTLSTSRVASCNHFYCRHCIVNFVVSKLQDNVTSIVCPERGCRGVLKPECRRSILPNEIFDSWINALWDQNGESSNIDSNNTFECDLCVEAIHLEDSFDIKGCNHFYCRQCIVNYFLSSKLQENVASIACPEPGCRGVLDPEYCRPILPNDVFDRWGKAVVENLIAGSETLKAFYCPFKDCSAMLIDDGNKIIQKSECPYCKKVFCVPWHANIDCVEFQKLNEGEREREDIMLRNLAQKEKWRRCPSCQYYVAKKSGCSYIKCRS
ncbi:putative transcription factor C2H2 family [Rosa chinensis]|uniref:RBR-type E3 ubiquitin transferase n=1 Tax=Rosa chinensis TaxID=74649 RepID=A0A2P6RKY9_ROSCH|nr:putative transcription factor C2H2 family [Rosa chinensis]